MRSFSLLGALEALNDIEENDDNLVLRVNIPLMMRLLEYAKEDAKSDVELHQVVERLIDVCRNGDVADMSSYNRLIGNVDNDSDDQLEGTTESDKDKKPTYNVIVGLRRKDEADAFADGIKQVRRIAKHGGDIELFVKINDELETCDFKAHDLIIGDIKVQEE